MERTFLIPAITIFALLCSQIYFVTANAPLTYTQEITIVGSKEEKCFVWVSESLASL